MMRIGFAGLGRMGMRMAANLAEAGIDVIVWNRTRKKCEIFARDHGASIADSPMELVERTELVFSMLADDRAVDEFYLGAASGASVFVEMGTISVPQILKVHKALEHLGHRFVDAPVSGSTKAAGDAQLLIMAGAGRTTLRNSRRCWTYWGKRRFGLKLPAPERPCSSPSTC